MPIKSFPDLFKTMPGAFSRIAVAMMAGTLILPMVLPNAVTAQPASTPRVAPKARDSGAAQQQPQVQQQQVTPPTPIIPDPRNRAPAGLFTTFDDKQKAVAARVSTYLSSLQNLSGQFVQVGPDGSRSTGIFYIQKPGKVRFEYDAPSPVAIVADGSSVVVRDSKLATQDLYPLSQTPLRFLLSDKIDLIRDTNVVGVSADDMYVTVTIEEKQPLVGTSRLMLMLGAKDNQLKQWTITDPQGYDTTVAVYNMDQKRPIDPGLFKIDYSTDMYRNQ